MEATRSPKYLLSSRNSNSVRTGGRTERVGEVDVGLPGQGEIRNRSQSDLRLVTERPQITMATWRGSGDSLGCK